jgi:cysteine desulfuration protein SufE
MTILKKEQELIEEFELFEDWMDKYSYLIDLGKGDEEIETKYKISENLISGCNSQVWLIGEKRNDNIYFKADSDALIPKGIASLLVRLYSGNSANEIVNHEPIFIKEIGLEQHLSPNRANGLASMINKIKELAGKL